MKINGVPSNIYDQKYYLKHSIGFDWMVEKLSPYLQIKNNMNILDLGCGTGDLSVYMAKKGANVTGIDYSVDAIRIAKNNLKKENINIQNKVKFLLMNAKSLKFKISAFDMVISIDMFEHVYPYELERIMEKIKCVLKPNGMLFVHTEANKLYLNYFHKYYIYPMDTFIIKLNKYLTGENYPGLPNDPRNEYHKIQHVNEPTYFSLRELFYKHGFRGRIYPLNLYKKHISWKDIIYNIVVLLYPLSLFPPLSWLFAYDFICVMRKEYENSSLS